MLSSEVNTARAILRLPLQRIGWTHAQLTALTVTLKLLTRKEKYHPAKKIVRLFVRLCNTDHDKKHGTLYEAYSKQRKDFSIRYACYWKLQNTSETRIQKSF